MYFLKHTFACVLWFSDVQPTTHRVLAVLRSSQRLKPGRSRWENSLDMRTDGFPVPRTSAETEILKSLWVWNCVFWYFAEIPSHTLQSARWISTFFSPRMCWNVQAMSKDSAGAEALQEKVQLQAGASSWLLGSKKWGFTTNLWHFLYGNLSEPGTRKATAPKQ